METRRFRGVRMPRPTIRMKLAAIYGGLILCTGFALLAVVYLLLRRSVDNKAESIAAELAKKPGSPADAKLDAAAKLVGAKDGQVDAVVNQSGYDTLDQLLVVSAISLGAFVLVSLVTGWWMAGRLLAPVHRITATARDLSWRDLSARIALRRRHDELKELADTFDNMLDRLGAAFESQHRFIANASHELRTPLGIQRAAIQLGLDNPSPEELRRVRGHLLDANRRSERILDGLLLLAQCDGGLPHRRPVQLDDVVDDVVAEYTKAAVDAEVQLTVSGGRSAVLGEHTLLRQLVTNLVSNGIRYNHPGGLVELHTAPGLLVVGNTGPLVPTDQVERMFEPFVRLAGAHAGEPNGAGLGLSIVRSIAHAHEATAVARARPRGGLEVRVEFPRVPAPAY
ncbi:ATP-binding protein [Plantactinospora sp. B5E13]|uniref:sensor histidine kinase n=1 Tax=unclassified Plantactinospora TaxID=2631981 RepID=UPI00325D9C94